MAISTIVKVFSVAAVILAGSHAQLDPNCFDTNHRCIAVAAAGGCNNPVTVNNCPHSCNVCGLPEPKSIVSPDFECGGHNNNLDLDLDIRRDKRQIVFPDELAAAGPLVPPPIATIVMASGQTAESLSVNNTFCGAIPISDRFLLTAAHCVFDSNNPVASVRLGELDFASNSEANAQPADYDVETIIVHPDFKNDSPLQYNDIAMLRTIRPIQFNDAVFPFCLTDQTPGHGTNVTGAGFGFVNETHRVGHLQEADFNVVGQAECEREFGGAGQLPSLRVIGYPQLFQGSDVLCASYPGRDACEGDSGGPLFKTDDRGRRFVVGIVSQGVACTIVGSSVLPGIYINVAAHITFIDSVLADYQ